MPHTTGTNPGGFSVYKWHLAKAHFVTKSPPHRFGWEMIVSLCLNGPHKSCEIRKGWDTKHRSLELQVKFWVFMQCVSMTSSFNATQVSLIHSLFLASSSPPPPLPFSSSFCLLSASELCLTLHRRSSPLHISVSTPLCLNASLPLPAPRWMAGP